MMKKEKLEEILDDYEKGLGLFLRTQPGDEQELQTYLSMNRDTIEKLTPDECTTINVRLLQFAFHFQRAINRESAIVAWGTGELGRIVARDSGSYDKYMKHDIKQANICATNSVAKSYQDIIMWAEQRIHRLTYLSSTIKNLGDAFVNSYRAKVATMVRE